MRSLIPVLLLMAVIVGAPAWMLAGGLMAPPPPRPKASRPTLEQLKPLAALLTHRVVITDAIVTAIAGRTGELRAAVLVHGDAVISVELNLARIERIDHEALTAVLILPPPQVVSARVDHEHTQIFSIEASGLWSLLPGDEGRAEVVEKAMRQAQALVAKAAGEPVVIEQAQARAEGLIKSFFAESLRWSITVCWAEEPGVR